MYQVIEASVKEIVLIYIVFFSSLIVLLPIANVILTAFSGKGVR